MGFVSEVLFAPREAAGLGVADLRMSLENLCPDRDRFGAHLEQIRVSGGGAFWYNVSFQAVTKAECRSFHGGSLCHDPQLAQGTAAAMGAEPCG